MPAEPRLSVSGAPAAPPPGPTPPAGIEPDFFEANVSRVYVSSLLFPSYPFFFFFLISLCSLLHFFEFYKVCAPFRLGFELLDVQAAGSRGFAARRARAEAGALHRLRLRRRPGEAAPGRGLRRQVRNPRRLERSDVRS